MRIACALLLVGSALPAALPLQAQEAPQEASHEPSQQAEELGGGREESACASGCKAAKRYVPPLPREEFARLLAQFAQEPLEAGSKALETLLFHHKDARRFLASDLSPLDPQRRAFLEDEVSRTHAWIAFRVVDSLERERISIAPTRVPLGEKQHLWPTAVNDVQPGEFNGTIVRVGLDHLWVRY